MMSARAFEFIFRLPSRCVRFEIRLETVGGSTLGWLFDARIVLPIREILALFGGRKLVGGQLMHMCRSILYTVKIYSTFLLFLFLF